MDRAIGIVLFMMLPLEEETKACAEKWIFNFFIIIIVSDTDCIPMSIYGLHGAHHLHSNVRANLWENGLYSYFYL